MVGESAGWLISTTAVAAIDLHLGVHKTATTHLQKYWLACNGLNPAVYCPPLAEIRAQVTSVCEAAPAPSSFARARDWLGFLCQGRERVILTDENFLGNCESNFQQRALYPRATARLYGLAEVLDGRPVRVLISVRDYADYLRSAYCEAVRHTLFKPFRELYTGIDVAHRGWQHLVHDVRTVFPQAEVVCWCYEDLPDVRAPLSAALFAIDAARLPLPDERRERRTFSRLAVRLLDDIYHRAGSACATQTRASVEAIINKPQMPRFAPWQPDELTRFAAAYAHSVAALRAMSGVRFV